MCILVNPMSVKPFLNNTKFNCLMFGKKLKLVIRGLFLAVQNVRNLKRSMPYKM